MGIFIDTGIFAAARNKSEKIHNQTLTLLREIQKKKYGEFYTSDYIFAESVILMGIRTKKHTAMRDIGDFILLMPNLNFKYTDSKIFKLAWSIHEKYHDRILSFTDATIIAWCQVLSIEMVATVDTHFQGILKPIIPKF
jgi:predicted nucleic acid-binding protein